jgi:hypothetical protein
MEALFYNTMTHPIYSSLWNKYRPAILQLMVASWEGPQEYKLFDHEFKALNPKEKSYSFELRAYQGKAVNNIKASNTAKDLLVMLNSSRKALELMTEDHFEFTLTKQFVLRVTRIPVAPEPEGA